MSPMTGTRGRHGRYGRCRDCIRHEGILSGAIKPGKPGRPTVLTEDVLAKIAELRAQGVGYTRIADALGIGRTSVRRVLGKDAFGKPCQNSQVKQGGSET